MLNVALFAIGLIAATPVSMLGSPATVPSQLPVSDFISPQMRKVQKEIYQCLHKHLTSQDTATDIAELVRHCLPKPYVRILAKGITKAEQRYKITKNWPLDTGTRVGVYLDLANGALKRAMAKEDYGNFEELMIVVNGAIGRASFDISLQNAEAQIKGGESFCLIRQDVVAIVNYWALFFIGETHPSFRELENYYKQRHKLSCSCQG